VSDESALAIGVASDAEIMLFDLAYLAVYVSLAFTGSGQFSLDQLISKRSVNAQQGGCHAGKLKHRKVTHHCSSKPCIIDYLDVQLPQKNFLPNRTSCQMLARCCFPNLTHGELTHD
jgi:hypothetical protein